MSGEHAPHPRSDLAARIKPDIPHAARIWNYWMGGKDNFEADRAAGDAVAKVYPDIVTMAMQSRLFLRRAVSYLAAEAGIDQFLDIGTGLPTMQNTHEIAQAITPASRIVYVDNDPLVLTHARALLVNTTPEGVTTYVDGDYHEPELIISDARNVLDFTRPIAVMFMGVLGYVADLDEVRSIVSRVMAEVPSGSHLVLWDGTNTGTEVSEGSDKLAESGAVPYYLRTLDELAGCFAGLELVEPGLAPISHWRLPDDADEVQRIDAYGAVARKP
ncbi:SAM-dependent methyltransferase [Nonomuraea sp. NPDC059194]|uniref:SAM-dependent methyltransferase n=1 Tax=Nonomuraea sp. NPDC059194 TaxID=3346764 RepID=UPI0036870CC2